MPYKDKGKGREAHKKWRERNKEHIREYNAKNWGRWCKLNPISPEHFKEPHYCQICGKYLGDKPLSYRSRHKCCRSCARGGRPLHLCPRCGKGISWQSHHCRQCYNKIYKPYIRTPEIREKNRQARQKRWENQELKVAEMRAMARGQVKKPNKPEQKLMALLDKHYPNQWKFTGDGSFWVGKLNPDFISTNGKKLAIDLFGDYWHNRANIPSHKTELGRVMLMNAYGYRVLVVWDYELDDTEAVKSKIDCFVNANNAKQTFDRAKTRARTPRQIIYRNEKVLYYVK